MAVNEGLSEEERAELEQLRAEKAAREQAERDAAERAELDRLRAEKKRAAIAEKASREEASRAAQLAADREHARKIMEPDEDDLKMAPGQKIVIAVVVGVALVWLLVTVIG